jgi:hypothetical protein
MPRNSARISSKICWVILHFDRHLTDPQDVFSKPGDFVGMKQQQVVIALAQFGIEPFGIKGWIQLVGISVGIAIDRGPRSIQRPLYRLDVHQTIVAIAFWEGRSSDRGWIGRGRVIPIHDLTSRFLQLVQLCRGAIVSRIGSAAKP